MCTPREELFTALNSTYTCMVRVVRDVYEANGITAYGRTQDFCTDLENFGPCFEGIVDEYVILYVQLLSKTVNMKCVKIINFYI